MHRMRVLLTLTTFVGGAFALPHTALAATFLVPDNYPTIQGCIYAAQDGDECVVAPATYNEVINFLGKAIIVRSTDPSDPEIVETTIIDGAGLNGSVVECISGEGPATVLAGLTITGGTGSPCSWNAVFLCGGGMFNDNGSRPTVSDCVFRDNVADLGGGMYNNFVGTAPTITGCTFSANSATYGGGMDNHNNSSPSVTNCTFTANVAGFGGGMHNQFNSHPEIINSIFVANAAVFGGAIYSYYDSDSIITNCAFAENEADYGALVYNQYFSNPTITNSILWSIDSESPDVVNYASSSSLTVTFSDVLGGVPASAVDGGGNIDTDPLFKHNPSDGGDGWGDDARTSSWDEGGNDDYGNLRLRGNSPCIDVGNNDAVSVQTDFDGDVRIFDGDGDSILMVDLGPDEYVCRPETAPIRNVTTGVGYCEIQLAINEASPSDEIVVSPGSYNETIDFGGKAITLKSTIPSDPSIVKSTIIDGTGLNSSVVKCVSGEGPDTVLDGLTITGGSGSPCGYLGSDNCGGGMLNEGSSPTVSNCRFRDNAAGLGGGMSNLDSSPMVTDCLFTSNDGRGGGMHNSENSNPALADCVFSENSNVGIYSYQSSARITNCAFVANHSEGIGGGISSYESNLVLDDCTFVDNTADRGAGIHSVESTLRISNCTFLKNIASDTGGGMYSHSDDLEMSGCVFDQNVATYYGGGGMWTVLGNQRLTQCVFTGNSAREAGGAMLNSHGQPAMIGCTFTGNSAKSGGGVYNLANSVPTFSDCTFDRNVAESSGGGMCNFESAAQITNCTFSDNTAEFGGGISIRNSEYRSTTIVDSAFLRNTAGRSGGGMGNYGAAGVITRCTFSMNSAREGGGLSDGSIRSTVTQCEFRENTATSEGGGVSTFNSIMYKCVFVGNSAYRGGGVYSSAYGSPQMSHSVFDGNSATYGGGLYVTEDSSPTVADSAFMFNTADYGGGVYTSRSMPTISRTLLSNNNAEVAGGAISLSGGRSVLIDCQMTSNSAISGGALATTSQADVQIANCDFDGNSAEYGGGLWNRGGDPDLINCVFSGNSAEFGGGIHSTSWGSPSVFNSTFAANIAVNGSTLACESDQQDRPSTVALTNCILWDDSNGIWKNDSSTITITSSDAQGGISVDAIDGGANIDADPMFLRDPDDGGDGWGDDPKTPDIDEAANDDYGDLRLRAASPCVDAGDATLLPSDAADLDADEDVDEVTPFDFAGHARVLGENVDIGAYETGFGDPDANDIVNHLDYAAFEACMTGPGDQAFQSECEPFDFNGDESVDTRDFAMFLAVFDGP
jgi:predicted outer membrane repeat protein